MMSSAMPTGSSAAKPANFRPTHTGSDTRVLAADENQTGLARLACCFHQRHAVQCMPQPRMRDMALGPLA